MEYTQCTYAESPLPWCATQTDSSGNVVTGQWGDCQISSSSSCTAPRLSLTDTDRLLDATKRSIEIDKLEKYILGKKSVELEIEFGIPRSQLCRWDDFVSPDP